ncbi:MAG TPA: RIP metalloprotease RseP [Gemmatimonadaceae bacterium]|jgi:regulator of sigma E protease
MALLAPLLVFGLVIFVHELGHFLAAKATGVYAPRFSIGFGPSIFRFRRGETEYVLAWLPLGGYVRMASRHDAEASFIEGGNEEQNARSADDKDYDPEAMVPFGPKPVPEDRWFESKPLWARIVIMIAGVVMNIILALVVATCIFLNHGQPIVHTTVVGGVAPLASAPQLAQLQTGDTIRAVDGKPVATWNDVVSGLAAASGKITFTTQHGDVVVPLGKGGAAPEDINDAISFHLSPVVDSIVEGDPAQRGGLQRGDSIVSVNAHAVTTWSDMVGQVAPSANKPLTFVVARHSALDTLTITPKAAEVPDPATGNATTVGRIGAAAKNPSVREPLGLVRSFSLGWTLTWSYAGQVFKVLHDIGSGDQSVRQLGGPIAITRAAVDAARSGMETLFRLIALLSVNVAVLNLLPVPILDGGQILINVLESAKGSPFSMRTREYILRVGLFAIGLLFVTVMYNDTRGGFVKLFSWIGKLFGA